MKKIVVIPSDREMLERCLLMNIDGIILPIKDLSVNSSCYFDIGDVKEVIKRTDKEVLVSVNKIMENNDLSLLEDTLVLLSELSVSKVLFYDLAVMNICKRRELDLDLAIFQDHLNASVSTNLFYKKRGINYSVITNDITMDEINEIGKVQSLMMICYGYLPMFYSRRYLISNYLEFIGNKKKYSNYTIVDDKDHSYMIVEESSGTTIYTREPINLINKVDKLDIDYVILNSCYIDDNQVLKDIDKYISHSVDDKEYYTGFLEKKTVYKVEDYE